MTQRGRYGKYIQSLCTIVDFLVVNGVYAVTCVMENGDNNFNSRIMWFLVNLSYAVVVLWLLKNRQVRSARMDMIVLNALRVESLHALVLLSLSFMLSVSNVPVSTYFEFYGICFVALPLWWVVARMIMKFYRRRGLNFTRAIIIGTNATSMRLYNEMLSDAGYGYRIIGVFGRECPAEIPAEMYRGGYDGIEEFMQNENVDEIYYTLSGKNEDILRRIVKMANDNVVQFYYVPQISRYVSGRFDLMNIGSVPMLTLSCNPLKRTINRVIKRVFDIVFSTLVIAILGPIVFIPVAIAIKLSSPGPIFFKQKRTGYRGKDFDCWKFRTMRVNADSDRVQAKKDDPRKTRVGDFLRRTSIDELPQFINVLTGSMSVVGPRPHMLAHTDEYRRLIDEYMVRHKVKPGITGWAQVNGYRGQTSELWQMEKRVEHDVWYIENWSFLLDMRIIVRTVVNALRGEKNAF